MSARCLRKRQRVTCYWSNHCRRLLPWPDNQVALRNCLDNICAADYANHLPITHHRDALDMAFAHEYCNLANWCHFVDGNDLWVHNISRALAISTYVPNDIGLRDDAEELAILVDNGCSTNTFSAEKLR